MSLLSKLIIATGNFGKYKEFEQIINHTADNNFTHEIIFAPDKAKLIVEESGKSYAENAMLKARAWTKKTGLPCLSDDSGLEVEALNGAPGLYSARIIKGTDRDKAEWLLSELDGYENRKARFSAALCLCVPDEYTLVTEGYCYGTIAESQRGFDGFGYDPVFIPDGYTMTFAELGSEIKNNISHRANAFRKICRLLNVNVNIKA